MEPITLGILGSLIASTGAMILRAISDSGSPENKEKRKRILLEGLTKVQAEHPRAVCVRAEPGDRDRALLDELVHEGKLDPPLLNKYYYLRGRSPLPSSVR
jgi:hypothetical protein